MTEKPGLIVPADDADMASKAAQNVAYNAALRQLSISMKAAAGSIGQIVIAAFPDGTIRVHTSQGIGVHHMLAGVQTLVDVAGKAMVAHVRGQEQQLNQLALENQRLKTGAAGSA